MSYYDEVYLKRLNRYGMDYQSRTQGKRERVFEDLLKKSIYRVDFEYNGEIEPGILERNRQDVSKTIQYLLTRENLNIPNGTILQIPNKDYQYGEELTEDNSFYWMVYYLENIKASGYNRYIVLKMTHYISWKDREGITRNTFAYFYGQQDNVLRDSVLGGRKGVLYEEPEMTSTLIIPLNEYIKKEDYFEVIDREYGILEAYRVIGYDIQSNPGVQFITVDPVYERDKSPAPEKRESDRKEDFYWLNGGIVDEQ